ncbi:unnamed protein product [Symbiodinium microadriaticum]|nr:unnamed protein product [Symbiodinium sp. KB8]CAE7864800.1 unnamed protein product [Symbiodinium microadriaticum]
MAVSQDGAVEISPEWPELANVQRRLNESKARNDPELQSCLEFLLNELATMSPDNLKSLENFALKQKQCQERRKFNRAVGLVGGDPCDLRDRSQKLMDDEHVDKLNTADLEKEVTMCLKAALQQDCLDDKMFPSTDTVDTFLDAAGFFDKIENGGLYFLYYAGHGFEVNDEFYFIPGKPKTIQSCVKLSDVLEQFKRFYDCTFVICINSCRSPLVGDFKDSICNTFVNKPGSCVSFNNYVLMFPTASGVPAVEAVNSDTGNARTFPKIVRELLPTLMTKDSAALLAALNGFAKRFKEEAQDNPALYFYPSAHGKPPTMGYTELWGLWHQVEKDIQQTVPYRTVPILDYRKDHRRRVNRMTADLALELPSPGRKPPVCIILGHTRGLSWKDYVARFIGSGMSANYLITTEGRPHLLVAEEHMAWDYNLAYWGGSGFVEGEGFMESKGKLNELKTYSISIALELRDQEEYNDAQYQALTQLLLDISGRWKLEPWNILGADEVGQDPDDPEPGPGKQINWRPLMDEGFSLKVSLPLERESGGSEASKLHGELPKKLEEWGYAFGPREAGAKRVFLEKRRAAFSHRYGIQDKDGLLVDAVDALLQQRSSRRDISSSAACNC